MTIERFQSLDLQRVKLIATSQTNQLIRVHAGRAMRDDPCNLLDVPADDSREREQDHRPGSRLVRRLFRALHGESITLDHRISSATPRASDSSVILRSMIIPIVSKDHYRDSLRIAQSFLVGSPYPFPRRRWPTR